MPEFVMDTSGHVETRKESESIDWKSLDEFTQGYIEALFFTENVPNVYAQEFESPEIQKQLEQGTLCGSIPADACFGNIDAESLERIIEDCRSFQQSCAHLLEKACEFDHYDMTKAGSDFWYTRNGHGVGYWDRGLGDVGDQLSDESRPYGEVYVYWNDGKIHLG